MPIVKIWILSYYLIFFIQKVNNNLKQLGFCCNEQIAGKLCLVIHSYVPYINPLNLIIDQRFHWKRLCCVGSVLAIFPWCIQGCLGDGCETSAQSDHFLWRTKVNKTLWVKVFALCVTSFQWIIDLFIPPHQVRSHQDTLLSTLHRCIGATVSVSEWRGPGVRFLAAPLLSPQRYITGWVSSG